jgi:hypothetical protein
MKSRLATLAREQQRGAATVEAILALFAFILIWSGVIYMGRLYQTQLQAKATARTCAWLMSASACQSTPSECSVVIHDEDDSDKSQNLKDRAETLAFRGRIARLAQAPLKGQLANLFGGHVGATSAHPIERPPLLGGGTVELSARYSLPCNTKKTTVKDTASDMMNTVLEDGP